MLKHNELLQPEYTSVPELIMIWNTRTTTRRRTRTQHDCCIKETFD